mgnify:CR=1 FL=1
MKKVLISVLLTAGLAVSLNASAQGNAEAGKDKVAVCAGCHGADGNSAVGSFPKLAGQGAKYLNKQLQDIKSGARPIVEMTGLLDNLSDQDLLDISAFYASQSIVIGQANKDLAAAGAAIYRAGIPEKNVAACMACHGPSGTGIELASFPALGGQHAEYTASQLKKFRVGERTNDGDTLIMRSIAARLSDREIEAVSAYISGLYE